MTGLWENFCSSPAMRIRVRLRFCLKGSHFITPCSGIIWARGFGQIRDKKGSPRKTRAPKSNRKKLYAAFGAVSSLSGGTFSSDVGGNNVPEGEKSSTGKIEYFASREPWSNFGFSSKSF